ncbi:BON domain-containing protein [Deinococcus multiflagellatus]|uniref:BON domain-containing protein n=1 Tax=Deinococcus multiflagellatus TaxID=1656887 RepID=A0ABW1ZRX1_9DEIO|nr:BON domain-containing protein [Deinococcus multiflagellatus]MBZ9714736.1 BON domain-containing protein [Deinococcus multiflagellatus]
MWPFGKSTAERVKDALNEQPRLQGLGLQVEERGGEVKVTGMVPNDRYLNLIRVVAGGINGVKTVDVSGVTFEQASAPQSAPQAQTPQAQTTDAPLPELQPDLAPTTGNMNARAGTPAAPLEPLPQSGGQDDADMEDNSRIAKAVHQALRSNGELADDPIDVLQSGKSIILRGVVDNDHEQRLAEKLARAVDGVAGVDISGLRVAAGAKQLAKEKDQDTGDTVYTVKAGDSLSEIAQKYYGDAMQYKKIAHYNNISNPDLIQPGQKLRIPG